MKPIPVPPGEEVAPKLVRLLYFVGAGVVCTAAINKWKEFEKKSMIQKEQQTNGSPLENPSAAETILIILLGVSVLIYRRK